jgi:lysozyme family protein
MNNSSFNKGFEKIVIGYEGGFSGWVNDPDDKGGETYAGISRISNPQWSGWPIIDAQKKQDNFPKNLNNVPGLKDMVKLRYKEHYWDQVEGDTMPEDLAVELFDIAVHISDYKAIKFLQIGLNKLNRAERYYNNIVVDGKLGPQTRGALTAFLGRGKLYRLVKVINILQGNHYLNLMENNEVYEKYIGWFDRVE